MRRAVGAAAVVALAALGLCGSAAAVPVGPDGVDPAGVLAGWHAALDSREEQPATVLVVGDSISEGAGSSNLTRRWVERLQVRLRTAFPTPGVDPTNGADYRSAFYGHGDLGPEVVGSVEQTTLGGLGYRGVTLGVRGVVRWRTVEGETARVWYSSGPFGGTFRVRVDGRRVLEVSTAQRTRRRRQRWIDVDLGAPGPHRLSVERVGREGLAPEVDGLEVVDPDANGVHVVDASHSGVRAGSVARGAPNGPAPVDPLSDWVTRTGADLAIVALGVNDWDAGVRPDVFGRDLQRVIRGLRAARPRLPILLVAWWRPASHDNSHAAWAPYVAAMRTVVESMRRVLLADFSDAAAWPQPRSAGARGLYVDGVHPSDRGHEAVAAALEEILVGA